jgi:hypothetical protein
MKLVSVTKVCSNETYSKVRLGKYFSDMFPIQNGLKQGDGLSSLLFNYASSYAIWMGLKLNGTHQLLVYVDM